MAITIAPLNFLVAKQSFASAVLFASIAVILMPFFYHQWFLILKFPHLIISLSSVITLKVPLRILLWMIILVSTRVVIDTSSGATASTGRKNSAQSRFLFHHLSNLFVPALLILKGNLCRLKLHQIFFFLIPHNLTRPLFYIFLYLRKKQRRTHKWIRKRNRQLLLCVILQLLHLSQGCLMNMKPIQPF